MRTGRVSPLLVSMALTACTAGSGVGSFAPRPLDATYVVADTITIAIQGMGQSLEIAARSNATLDVAYRRSGSGVAITATVEELVADVVTPMTEPLSIDEGELAGEFTFSLDERGRAVSTSSPPATGVGGQVFSAPIIAHSLFPRLPGGVLAVGDTWADSVTYRETSTAGVTEVRSSLTYRVLGETLAGGRALVEVGYDGAAGVSQDLDIEGAALTQSSELVVSGRFLWDVLDGVLHGNDLTMEGPGTVRAAMLPVALPTRVRWETRVARIR